MIIHNTKQPTMNRSFMLEKKSDKPNNIYNLQKSNQLHV